MKKETMDGEDLLNVVVVVVVDAKKKNIRCNTEKTILCQTE